MSVNVNVKGLLAGLRLETLEKGFSGQRLYEAIVGLEDRVIDLDAEAEDDVKGKITTVEVNLGSTPAWRGSFTIPNAEINPNSKIIIQQASGPYSGKGSKGDESEMDQIFCVAEAGPGQAVVRWRTVGGIGPTSDKSTSMVVKGMVKGNFKFNYMIT